MQRLVLTKSAARKKNVRQSYGHGCPKLIDVCGECIIDVLWSHKKRATAMIERCPHSASQLWMARWVHRSLGEEMAAALCSWQCSAETVCPGNVLNVTLTCTTYPILIMFGFCSSAPFIWFYCFWVHSSCILLPISSIMFHRRKKVIKCVPNDALHTMHLYTMYLCTMYSNM